jgi:hypothetical protein
MLNRVVYSDTILIRSYDEINQIPVKCGDDYNVNSISTNNSSAVGSSDLSLLKKKKKTNKQRNDSS